MKDVIVIGGGPAGITAAIYLKRFKRDVTIIMKDYGTLEKTDFIENYYGFVEPLTGQQLIENGINQAKRFEIDILNEEVVNIGYDGTFLVKTIAGEYQTKSVVLATGANRARLRVKGFNEYSGKGISYCAICDGFMYRDRKVGILGNSEYMLEEFEVLKNITKDLTVFTNGLPLEVDVQGQKTITSPLKSILGDEVIRGVVTEDGQQYEVDALFVALGTASASDFALKMGAFTNKNEIIVDENYMTNIPGLFAAGDCIGGLYQIAKAVSDGAHVAFNLNKYLRQIK